MANIEYASGIARGVTDDGRIEYASCNRGPRIDGLLTIRGYYCNAVGGMDLDAPVDPATWRQAIDLMDAVDARMDAENAKGRFAQESRQTAMDAAHDRIAQVRGGPLDPNTF